VVFLESLLWSKNQPQLGGPWSREAACNEWRIHWTGWTAWGMWWAANTRLEARFPAISRGTAASKCSRVVCIPSGSPWSPIRPDSQSVTELHKWCYRQKTSQGEFPVRWEVLGWCLAIHFLVMCDFDLVTSDSWLMLWMSAERTCEWPLSTMARCTEGAANMVQSHSPAYRTSICFYGHGVPAVPLAF
jgi:hypothetical protein